VTDAARQMIALSDNSLARGLGIWNHVERVIPFGCSPASAEVKLSQQAMVILEKVGYK